MRAKSGDPTEPLIVRYPRSLIKRLDEVRGASTRGAFLRRLAEEALRVPERIEDLVPLPPVEKKKLDADLQRIATKRQQAEDHAVSTFFKKGK